MCSLTNAIKLYKEDKQFIIVGKNNQPIKNEKYINFEKANIDRIYYQPEYNELLKVIEI